MAGVYLDEHWDRCPIADIDRDPSLTAVLMLRRSAKLNPIAGYPEVLPVWVTSLWGELEHAEAARRADEIEGGARG